MDKVEIKAYQTHITVHPYHLGDVPEVELMVSKKSKALHGLIPIGYYINSDTETLYLARGIDLNTLEYLFRSTPVIVDDSNSVIYLKKGTTMKVPPRDREQELAIDFLMRRNQYQFADKYSQLALNLPTGFGKTYCAINALISGRKRAVIICHSKQIRDQWFKGFEEYTNIDMNTVMVIDGSKDVNAILDGTIKASSINYYIVLHQTLTKIGGDDWTVIENFFNRLKVYIKVIDEAHLYFENSLMLDFFSNVPLTYYITATFGRSDPQENAIYKLAYNQVLRYEVKRKADHTISYVILFNSHPSENYIRFVEKGNSYGFSNTQYMKYQIERSNELIRAVKMALKNTQKLEGKRLITCNLVHGLERLQKAVNDVNPDWKCIVIKGDSTQEERKKMEDADVICATSKIIGTGSDIHGLRILINTESMASKINIEQLMGRLRPYYDADGDELNTIFMHLVDIGFPKCQGMYARVRSTINRGSIKLLTFEL